MQNVPHPLAASLAASLDDKKMPDQNPLQEEGSSLKIPDPCILVIFGATGDLTSRKLLPALYNLQRDGQLPTHFACVGFSRREKSHDLFREEMHQAVNQFSRVKPVESTIWNSFSNQIYYHISNFDDDKGYDSLKIFLQELDKKHGTKGNRLFYLSTQPSFFPIIIEKLNKHGLIYNGATTDKWSRVIIEKPFGHDYHSAIELQQFILRYLSENQIYRIDHYLGKETVQNLLVFRFANSIFEALWNHKYIDHVQITVAEEIGIGTRGAFFEEEGISRDVVQNHMMQLLSLVAMEPPNNLKADTIRDEKVKVLQALRPLDLQKLSSYVVRGQYAPGYINGERVRGYREEDKVDPNSSIETYMAMELYIDNWRWTNVPFYLRAGKRLPKRATEIAIAFHDVPGNLFSKQQKKKPENNVLVIRIQPNEGISLKINSKVPGPQSPIQPVKMDFNYSSYFGLSPPEAYERLICDAILGDGTLFARGDEVLASWKMITPILEKWHEIPVSDFPNYAAGSWGPKAADELLQRSNRSWRLI